MNAPLQCSFEVIAKAAEASEGNPRRAIELVASTATIDRAGDQILPAGILLTNYRKNPIVLFNHQTGLPIARAERIGLDDSGRLTARAEFPSAGISSDSDRIYGLIKEGILNAASVSLKPVKSVPIDLEKPFGGRRYEETELLELSIVSVPANPQAAIISRAAEIQPRKETTTMQTSPVLDLQRQRDHVYSQHQSLAAMATERSLNEQEMSTLEDYGTKIKDLDTRIDQLQKIEEQKTALARPVERQAPPALIHMASGRVEPFPVGQKLEKGIGFGLFAVAQVLRKSSDLNTAIREMERHGYMDIAKALATSPLAAGGALVPVRYASEVIELLREQSVIMKAGPRVIDLDGFGSIRFPVQATGTVANYVGENANIPYSEATFTELLMTPKKLAVITAASNELIRRSVPAAATVMRDDAAAAMQEKMDNQLLVGTGSATAPAGLVSLIDPANKFPSTGTTIAAMTTDLYNAQLLVRNAHITVRRGVYFMSPRTETALKAMRDLNGNRAFPEMDQGLLLGQRFFSTTAIVDNGGVGTNESSIIFVDMAETLLVQELSLAVDVSTEAAYIDGSSALVSAWSRDQTVLRAIATHDWALRRAKAGAVIQAVTIAPTA